MREFVIIPGSILKLKDGVKDIDLDKIILSTVCIGKEQDGEFCHFHVGPKPSEMEFKPVSFSDDSAYTVNFSIPVTPDGDILTATVIANKRTLEVKISAYPDNGLKLESLKVIEDD